MKKESMNDEALLDRFMNEQFAHNGVSVSFPEDIAALKAEDLKPAPCRDRMDLRRMPTLTIDPLDANELDDAVSMMRTRTGYLLGIHIADLAAFVEPGSRLDEIAAERGCSIYLPDRTVPMLPPAVKERCSLEPNVDRNAVSVLVDLTKEGRVRKYMVTKSLIRSRVRGVYAEVNSIFSGSATPKVLARYRDFIAPLWDMKGLSEKLRKERAAAGADVSPTEEVKVSLCGGEVRLNPCRQGAAEMLIEEMMVLCNSLIARFCLENRIPCLFRTQEEKNVLAKYEARCGRHAELAIENGGYTHFTSPLRRLCDCRVHQALSDWLNGASAEELGEKYSEEYMEEAALLATKRFRRAQTMQFLSSQFCYARYFSRRCLEVYSGKVVGYNRQNLPILCMEEYPIRILGSLALNARIGERFSFRIAADMDTRRLFAQTPVRAAA